MVAGVGCNICKPQRYELRYAVTLRNDYDWVDCRTIRSESPCDALRSFRTSRAWAETQECQAYQRWRPPAPAAKDATLVEAVHASTNAPIRYYDEPAEVSGRRYWDGALGGYNNPVLAAVVEALANGPAEAVAQPHRRGIGKNVRNNHRIHCGGDTNQPAMDHVQARC